MNGAAFVLFAGLSLGVASTSAGPVPAAEPVSVRQILALLKAGVGETVILRQIEATRSRPVLDVDALLQLKNAGASDAFLEALMPGPSEPAPTEGTVSRGLRIFRQINEQGETVLHVTNLDESGRRIGGEVEHRPPPGLAAEPHFLSASRPAEEFEPAQAPVIINIYPAGQSAGLIPGDNGVPPSPYRFGRYPGLLLWPRLLRPPRPAAAQEMFFGRPRAIDTAPFRSATAAQRNRAHFKRN